MLALLSDRLLGAWDQIFQFPKPERLHYLGIPGSIEGGTISFLAFGQEGAKPLFAVKLMRQREDNLLIENEWRALAYLQSLGSDLGGNVPRPLWCHEVEGRLALIQSFMDGRPMPARLGEDGLPDGAQARRNIGSATGWLSTLHRRTRSLNGEGPAKPAVREEWELFFETFSFSEEERSLLRELEDHIEIIEKSGAVFQHGDFCRHNILTGSGAQEGIAVIDWMESDKEGLPLYDLFFFLTTYFLQIRKWHGLAGFMRAFEATFFDSNNCRAAVEESLKSYCEETGISWDQTAALFGFFLIHRSLFEYRQLSRSVERGFLPRSALALAREQHLGYEDLPKAQIWIHFFKAFARRRKEFLA